MAHSVKSNQRYLKFHLTPSPLRGEDKGEGAVLVIGIWLLVIIWNLGFEYWNFHSGDSI